MQAKRVYSIQDLLRVMDRLRDREDGCPWDLAQDFDSIVASTLEECYELVAAIEQGDFSHVAEELGDVLFQVVFYSQLGRERGLFDFSQIVSTLVGKLLRRHPHVFAAGEIEGVVEGDTSVQQVKLSWESIKKQERHARSQLGILADIPVALPALSRAQKVQKRAAQVGFDWDHIAEVVRKVEEELQEFVDAEDATSARQEEEIGDLLFSCVNLARHKGLDAETALRRATRKFEGRFQRLETQLKARGLALEELTAPVLEEHWRRAKSGD
ncbi:MAG: nucleoside triphosphate pyrophosphohydrolase [Gammaproteobacteria bacterium]|nr:nucleoside triphosphate pyrophosphohydrolase [Gammaproteobacteria bacterium]